MPIDTPNKRKSVINNGLPGSFLIPVPDGTIDVSNRRQLTDSYALPPVTISRSGWVKDRDSSETWVPDNDLSNSWVQDSVHLDTWVKDQEIDF